MLWSFWTQNWLNRHCSDRWAADRDTACIAEAHVAKHTSTSPASVKKQDAKGVLVWGTFHVSQHFHTCPTYVLHIHHNIPSLRMNFSWVYQDWSVSSNEIIKVGLICLFSHISRGQYLHKNKEAKRQLMVSWCWCLPCFLFILLPLSTVSITTWCLNFTGFLQLITLLRRHEASSGSSTYPCWQSLHLVFQVLVSVGQVATAPDEADASGSVGMGSKTTPVKVSSSDRNPAKCT